jgi:hypothetical protein
MEATDEGYATGAKDGTIKLWDTEFKQLTNVDLTETEHGYKGRFYIYVIFDYRYTGNVGRKIIVACFESTLPTFRLK